MSRIPNTSQPKHYYEFVASLSQTSPTETEFEVGQSVAYVNDYGVIFDDLTIMGFAHSDEKYGKIIYLNTDCYWCAIRPSSLRVIDENGDYEVREGEVVYERPILN